MSDIIPSTQYFDIMSEICGMKVVYNLQHPILICHTHLVT